jgi:hypothetical protein
MIRVQDGITRYSYATLIESDLSVKSAQPVHFPQKCHGEPFELLLIRIIVATVSKEAKKSIKF